MMTSRTRAEKRARPLEPIIVDLLNSSPCITETTYKSDKISNEVEIVGSSRRNHVISLLDDDYLECKPKAVIELSPKVEPVAKSRIPIGTSNELLLNISKPIFKYDYSSTSKTLFEINSQYTQEALAQLCHDFPWLKQRFLARILPAYHGRYSYFYDTLLSCFLPIPVAAAATGANISSHTEEAAMESIQLFISGNRKFIPPPTFLARFQQVMGHHMSSSPIYCFINNPRSFGIVPVVAITHEILLDEIQYVTYKWKQWKDKVQHQIFLRNARQDAITQGTTLECQCCYSQVAFEEMIACRNEGHLFCTECVLRHVQERIFGLGSFGNNSQDITCMYGDGCVSPFPYLQLVQCLPPKVLEKYNELQCHVALEKAAVKIGKCPKCNCQAEIDDEHQRIFHCPISTCNFKSCRLCSEEAHDPNPCEKRSETNARLKQEEAMTQAKIRTCPKCSTKFYKQDGCNKMTCSCGLWICYICRQTIEKNVGYGHFCQTPLCLHQNCKKCPLYTKGGE